MDNKTDERVSQRIKELRRQSQKEERKYWKYKFAGLAMQGMMCSVVHHPAESYARNAVEAADALLAALEVDNG